MDKKRGQDSTSTIAIRSTTRLGPSILLAQICPHSSSCPPTTPIHWVPADNGLSVSLWMWLPSIAQATSLCCCTVCRQYITFNGILSLPLEDKIGLPVQSKSWTGQSERKPFPSLIIFLSPVKHPSLKGKVINLDMALLLLATPSSTALLDSSQKCPWEFFPCTRNR